MKREKALKTVQSSAEKAQVLQPNLKALVALARLTSVKLWPAAKHVTAPNEQAELPIRLWPVRQTEGIDADMPIANMLLLNLTNGRRLALCHNQEPTLVAPMDFGFRVEYFRPVRQARYVRTRIKERPPLGEVELEASRWQQSHDENERFDRHDKTLCGTENNYAHAGRYITELTCALIDSFSQLDPGSTHQVAA